MEHLDLIYAWVRKSPNSIGWARTLKLLPLGGRWRTWTLSTDGLGKTQPLLVRRFTQESIDPFLVIVDWSHLISHQTPNSMSLQHIQVCKMYASTSSYMKRKRPYNDGDEVHGVSHARYNPACQEKRLQSILGLLLSLFLGIVRRLSAHLAVTPWSLSRCYF